MPTKNNDIIKYNHGEKSMKLPFVIYADLECLLEKMSTCINNPNESCTTKINKHTPSGYSIFTHCSFDKSKNKLNYYRGKDCVKKFSKDLREHASKIINYEKQKMIPLTIEEKIYHNKQKICYICKKEFNNNDTAGPSSLECKKNYKVRDNCHYTGKYRGAAHNICNLRYKVPKEIPIVFHNGSIYDYHLDSYRFMSSSLSKLVDNLSEGIHNNKCVDCKSNLDYVRITAAKPSSLERKNEKLLLKCFNCDSYYKKKFNKDLIKKFKSTYSFCNNDLCIIVLNLYYC